MKTLYDVQQLLKRFGLIIYMGKRLYDIEVMQIELKRLYDQELVAREEYLLAQLILRREHKIEIEREENKHG
ncbi:MULTISPECIES: YqgQ family protein [unclassified Streptococcus]|uniref:YqgQ family protein n=1 Tax=unclassified Streptococcus TaxID=2608887 RepID=UPI00359DE9AA